MDSVDIQGKKYISSKRAAKLTGYTQDYVGQLARGEKVPATRVGRSWYVSEEDILSHAGKDTPQEEKEHQKVALAPQAQKNTQSLHAFRTMHKKTDFKTWNEVQYVKEDLDLFPEVVLREETQKSDIDSKGNVSIKVKQVSSQRRSPRGQNQSVKSIDGIATRSHKEKKLVMNKEKGSGSSIPWIIIGTGVGVATFILIPFLGGFGISSEWVVSESQLSTAYEADFSMIFNIFSYIFVEGIALIKAFFIFIFTNLGALIGLVFDFFRS